MTLNQLASIIAKREGKRSQARIGDIREILGIMADVLHEAPVVDEISLIDALLEAGEKRAKRKKKPKARA